MLNIKGQSLLELVIALSFLIVIVTVITVSTANGLKNSQFSKNQVQATKIAQEGIERVRTIRDRNYSVCGVNSAPTTLKKFSNMWSESCAGANCLYTFKAGGNLCQGVAVSDVYWLYKENSSLNFEAIVANGVTFERRITVLDSSPVTTKEVQVRVTWIDSLGSHSSWLSTILTQL